MKIGLFGGMANNLYAMASSLYRHGVEVEILRDEFERYPTSQPWWEDCEVVIPSEQMLGGWTADRAREIESELSWEPPPYFAEPVNGERVASKVPGWRGLDGLRALTLTGDYPNRVRSFLDSVDVAVVCGMQAEILASRSITPFAIFPHGADIRLASGLTGVSGVSKRSIGQVVRHFQLKKAFSKSGVVFSNTSAIGGHLGKVSMKTTFGTFPKKQGAPLPHNLHKQDELQNLFRNLGVKIPKSSFYFFVPSRIDYHEKGTNILIEAIGNAKLTNCHFIFSGWGADFFDARSRLAEANSTFLPFALSKPLLARVMQLVDVVIDQFRMGNYGTSALEAISLGTPVMMKLDEERYPADTNGPPPVINAETAAEISDALRRVESGRMDLSAISREASEWFKKTHEESIVVPRLVKSLSTLMNR